MTWFQWLLIFLFVVGPMVEATQIGEPRKPRTGNDLALSIGVSAILIAGVLWSWK